MSAPLRSMVLLLLLWGVVRTAMQLPGAQQAMAPARVSAPVPVRALPGVPGVPRQIPPAAVAVETPAMSARAGARVPLSGHARAAALARPADLPPLVARRREAGPLPTGARLLLASYLAPMRRPDRHWPLAIPRAASREAEAGRWSGDAYVFVRGGGDPGLAPGAQLGGGQAFARIRHGIGGGLAATGRVSRALQGAGSEAAAGLAWRPRAALPLGVTVERRVALDAGGRDAWAAFAAGGADALAIAPAIRLDAYAQAGIVGARRRDGFIDGAARIGRVIGPVSIGGGAWGAAQPGAARVDVGPQAALRLALGDIAATAALDWRFRVAGRARPGGGLALTLAAGF